MPLIHADLVHFIVWASWIYYKVRKQWLPLPDPWTCIILLVFSDKGGKLGEPVCILKTPWLLGNRKYQVEKGANSTTFQSEKIYLPKHILTCDSGIHTLVYTKLNITNTFFQHHKHLLSTQGVTNVHMA